MGRGQGLAGLTAEQFETVFERMRRLNDQEPFIVKLTEAPHYRRFVIQNEGAKASRPAEKRGEVRRVLARARAYAATGDYLASDPCCAYAPA